MSSNRLYLENIKYSQNSVRKPTQYKSGKIFEDDSTQ